MRQQELRIAPGEPAIPPGEHGERHGVEIETLLRQTIFVAARPVLIGPSLQHAQLRESAETVGENVRRDPQVPLELVETSGPQEGLADDEPAPAIAENSERTCDWARALALEERRPRFTPSPRVRAAESAPSPARERDIDGSSLDRLVAFRAGEHRFESGAAAGVCGLLRLCPAVYAPALAPAHGGREAHEEIAPARAEHVLRQGRSFRSGSYLEQSPPRQLAEARLEGRARYAEPITEFIEAPYIVDDRLAQNQP